MTQSEAMIIGVTAQINVEVGKVVAEIMKRHPDGKHNQGRSILEAFVWDAIQKLASNKSDQVWDRMEKSDIYRKPDGKPGKDLECGESPHFIIKATVSEPVKRFNEGEL